MILDKAELKKLDNLLKSNQLCEKTANHLKCFLFACYTGLRFIEIQSLSFENIKRKNGTLFLEFNLPNVKGTIKYLVSKEAEKYLPTHKGKVNIFNVHFLASVNRQIKKALFVANISKRVSFYTARKTFINNQQQFINY